MEIYTEQYRHKSRRRRIRVGMFVAFAGLAVIFYALADRYLIEHVEVEVTPLIRVSENVAIAMGTETAAPGSTEVPTAAPDPDGSPDGEVFPESFADPQPDIQAAARFDAVSAERLDEGTDVEIVSADESAGRWSYQRGGVRIAIERVTRGSGADTVTYYVADIRLSDPAALQSAFAKNKFGRNIIETTSEIAAKNNAIFAVNGDYYGFRNDGIIIRNGVIYRNVPARIGLAIYQDGTMQIYDETGTDAERLLAQGVVNTLSFGPALVEDGVAGTDFSNTWIDTNFGNRTIENANPRTGIGLIDTNHFVFIVADGWSKGYSRGLTLEELAEIFVSLGATEAYNIDGGGSSAMYFMDELINSPLGRDRERGTSDILFIAGAEEPVGKAALELE